LSRRFRLNGKKKSAQLAAFVEGVGFRFADAIIVTSKAARDEVQARASQKPKGQLVSTYADTDLFAPRSAPTKSRFLYVGRLTKQKNLESLIRAAQLANVGVDIYGDGPLDDELRTLVRSLKADVEFYPRIPNTQLASVMNDYLFFALPSLHEGLPKVLLEAMSTGLICVGTDIPGTRDLITDGENGFLASGTSEHELLRPIREAVMADRGAIGVAARRLIQEKYGLQRYIDQESEVILGIIK